MMHNDEKIFKCGVPLSPQTLRILDNIVIPIIIPFMDSYRGHLRILPPSYIDVARDVSRYLVESKVLSYSKYNWILEPIADITYKTLKSQNSYISLFPENTPYKGFLDGACYVLKKLEGLEPLPQKAGSKFPQAFLDVSTFYIPNLVSASKNLCLKKPFFLLCFISGILIIYRVSKRSKYSSFGFLKIKPQVKNLFRLSRGVKNFVIHRFRSFTKFYKKITIRKHILYFYSS